MAPGTLILLLAAGAHAFMLTQRSGAVCSGGNACTSRLEDGLCYTFGRPDSGVYPSDWPDINNNTVSAYITYTGRVDANYTVQFFSTTDCSGRVLAEGDNGCLDFAGLDEPPRGFRRVPYGDRRRANNSVAGLLSPHDTMNAALRLAGRPEFEMPQPSGSGTEWLVLQPRRYVEVRKGKTLDDFWDLHPFNFGWMTLPTLPMYEKLPRLPLAGNHGSSPGPGGVESDAGETQGSQDHQPDQGAKLAHESL